MVKIQFFPSDFSYKIIENRPSIFIFGRTKEGLRAVVIDNSFKPYFYVSLKEGVDIDVAREKLESIRGTQNNIFFSIIKTALERKMVLASEKFFIKIFVNQPLAIPLVKEKLISIPEIEGMHETDISFIRKYVLEKGLVPNSLYQVEGNEVQMRNKCDISIEATSISSDIIESPPMKILSIFVDTPGFARSEKESDPISMISIKFQNIRKVFALDSEKGSLRIDHEDAEFIQTEDELLRRIIDLINQLRPDIISGYDSDNYDLLKLSIRAHYHNLRLDLSLDHSEPIFYKGNIRSVKITGISHIDLKKASLGIIKEFFEMDSKHIRGLDEALGGNLGTISQTKNPLLIVDSIYSMTTIYLSYFQEISKIIRLPLFDISRLSQNQFADWYLISQAHDHNRVLPIRSKDEEQQHEQVQKANQIFIKGIYDNIFTISLKGLFPSIVSTFNISEETQNCACCEDSKNIIDGSKNIWYCRKKEGFIPKLIGEILSRRQRIKEILKGHEEESLKIRDEILGVLLNSFRRILLQKNSRWQFSNEAKSVDMLTDNLVNQITEIVEKMGFRIVYLDSDQIIVAILNHPKESFYLLLEAIRKEVSLNIEQDEIHYYQKGLLISSKNEFTSKPRYALLESSGNIVLKGFEGQRSNYSNMAKIIQDEVLRILIVENNIPKALKQVNDTILKIKRKETLLQDYIFHVPIQKDISEYGQVTPHIAAANRMKKQGKDVRIGDIIQYVIITGSEPLRERVRLPEECADCIMDSEYYIQRQIIPAIEQIFMVFHIPKEMLLDTKDQKKLGQFF